MAEKIKIVLLGDSTVGKTCLTLKFCTDTVTKNYMSTIGVDVHNKEIETSKGTYRLQVWDTAGQERFRSISASYLRNTDGVLLLYDITNYETFTNISDWLTTIKQNCTKKQTILIVGNKKDLEDQRKVRFEEGMELAKKEGAEFIEVSAFTGDNVNEAFLKLTEQILKSGSGDKKDGDGFALGSGEQKKGKKCC
ncbi:MAG: GTP-binding protein [archaeon]|nr:GTP-binding protein [archaeon]